jgi:flagellar hook-basal body complex protein FliE
MDVTLKPFDFSRAVARAGIQLPGAAANTPAPVPGAQFQQALSQALKDVSASQKYASSLQREVALDNPTVSIEQTMVAMQKAQIGFQATLQTRNKLVQAYSEIMNMQV